MSVRESLDREVGDEVFNREEKKEVRESQQSLMYLLGHLNKRGVSGGGAITIYASSA